MTELQEPAGGQDRVAESVRRALKLVGPAERGAERVGDERPGERTAA